MHIDMDAEVRDAETRSIRRKRKQVAWGKPVLLVIGLVLAAGAAAYLITLFS